MPTREAAEVTDRFRRELALLRATHERAVRRHLLAVPLDATEREIEEFLFRRWAEDSTRLLTSAQRQSVDMTTGYLRSYLVASGVTPSWDGPDSDLTGRYTDQAGTRTRRLSDALTGASTALLFRLGRGDGRADALLAGASRASRVANESIQQVSRQTMAEGMQAEPRVATYRRVTASNPCGGCLALAGEESPSETVGLPYHTSCGCSAEPVVSGVRDEVRRPTGQEMFDRLDEDAQARMFAGAGGSEKAALVREQGVSALVAFDRAGHLVEAPLQDLMAA